MQKYNKVEHNIPEKVLATKPGSTITLNAPEDVLAVVPGQTTTTKVSKGKMEKLLVRWVNIDLPATSAALWAPLWSSKATNREAREAVARDLTNRRIEEARKLRLAFPDMFISEATFRSERFMYGTKPQRTAEQLDITYAITIAQFARRLQRIWNSPFDDNKQRLFGQLHYWILKFFLRPESPLTPEDLMEEGHVLSDPLDHLLVFLGENLSRLKHCPNPSCKHPYFLASKGNSKFCTEDCANYGRKLNKLRYWRTKGSANRDRTTAAAARARSKNAKRSR
jgi:hypothetical protein